MSPESEELFILKILNAWKFDGTTHQVPWHITEKGWKVYNNHPSQKVRDAANAHPSNPKGSTIELGVNGRKNAVQWR